MLGRVDGIYQMKDGTLLITDWNSARCAMERERRNPALAKGFKGPADFCVIPDGKG